MPNAPKPAGLPIRSGVWASLGIACCGLLINIVVATSMAETADERVHVAYGAAVLAGHPERSSGGFDSKMPVSVLNALPARTGDLMSRQWARSLHDMRAARYGTMAAAFCLSLLVFVYARSLYGRAAALMAQALFTIEPNIIAHSTLSTTDLYAALAVVLFLYCLRRFLLTPTVANGAIAGSTLALAFLTKFSAAYLLVVVAIAIPAAVFGTLRLRLPARKAILAAALAAACFLTVLNAGFLFDRPFTPLSRYNFLSSPFQRLQRIPGLRSLPVPLPYPYLAGLDWMYSNNATGTGFGNICLLGEVRGSELPRSDGFPSYYAVAYLLKEPIGMQLILAAALFWILRQHGRAEFAAAEGLLLCAAAVFWIALSSSAGPRLAFATYFPSWRSSPSCREPRFKAGRDSRRAVKYSSAPVQFTQPSPWRHTSLT